MVIAMPGRGRVNLTPSLQGPCIFRFLTFNFSVSSFALEPNKTTHVHLVSPFPPVCVCVRAQEHVCMHVHKCVLRFARVIWREYVWICMHVDAEMHPLLFFYLIRRGRGSQQTGHDQFHLVACSKNPFFTR